MSDSPPPSATLRRLLPPGPDTNVADALLALGLREAAQARSPGDRPLVVANMVHTVDGRAAVAGRSGPLSSPADRELFHGLRGLADAVLVGAGTVRAEGYGRMIRDPARRLARRQAGLAEEPLACIVSRSQALSPDLPLLRETAARVVILTPSAATLPATGARVQYLRCEGDGDLDLGGALRQLRARLGVGLVVCEGGPRLNGSLLTAGLLDEVFLSQAPLLAGGQDALPIVLGPELSPPVQLRLLSAVAAGSHLFLRYRVGGDGGRGSGGAAAAAPPAS